MKKRNNYKRILSEEEKEANIIWDKLKEIFAEHGALNSFEVLLKKTMFDKYDDLSSYEVIDSLFKRDRTHSHLLYMDDTQIKQVSDEIQLEGYEMVKIDTLAQQYKFEAFMADMEENPYQLKLIA